MRILVAAFLVGFVAGPAFAETTGTTAVAAPTEDPLDKIVCKAMAPVVGSRLGATRQCATQREWNQRQADSQKALSDSQRTFSTESGH